jgi:hypothetical protein
MPLSKFTVNSEGASFSEIEESAGGGERKRRRKTSNLGLISAFKIHKGQASSGGSLLQPRRPPLRNQGPVERSRECKRGKDGREMTAATHRERAGQGLERAGQGLERAGQGL